MARALSSREKRIFAWTILVVLAAAFYNAVFLPLQEKKNVLSEQIIIRQKLMRQEQGIIRKAMMIEERYQDYWRQFYRSGTQEEAVSSILTDLEGVVRTLSLDINDLKPQNVRDTGFNRQFSVSLTINSELKDVMRFLYTLQQKPYLFDVEEMQLDKTAAKTPSVLRTRLVLSKAFILSGSGKRDLPR